MRADLQFLEDVIDSTRQIAVLVDGLNSTEFQKDRRTRSAALHELTVIEEAVRKVSDELKSRYPDIPWNQIVGTRNVIVHGYFDLHWERIWLTCTTEVPALRSLVTEIVASEFPESGG